MRPAYGSVGAYFIFLRSGFALYMLRRFIVARVRNCDPGFPPDGSGRYGFELALPLLKADPPFFVPNCFCLWILPCFYYLSERFLAIPDAFLFAILIAFYLLLFY